MNKVVSTIRWIIVGFGLLSSLMFYLKSSDLGDSINVIGNTLHYQEGISKDVASDFGDRLAEVGYFSANGQVDVALKLMKNDKNSYRIAFVIDEKVFKENNSEVLFMALSAKLKQIYKKKNINLVQVDFLSPELDDLFSKKIPNLDEDPKLSELAEMHFYPKKKLTEGLSLLEYDVAIPETHAQYVFKSLKDQKYLDLTKSVQVMLKLTPKSQAPYLQFIVSREVVEKDKANYAALFKEIAEKASPKDSKYSIKKLVLADTQLKLVHEEPLSKGGALAH